MIGEDRGMERTGGCMCCVCCVADTAPLANAAASVKQAGGSHAAGRAWRRVLQGMRRDDGPGGGGRGGGGCPSWCSMFEHCRA